MLHPLRDLIPLPPSLQFVLLISPFNLDSHKFFSFLSFQGVCFVIIFAVVGRVEGVVVDRSRNDGGDGRDVERKRKRRKCVNFSPNSCDKYLTSQDV